MKVEVCSEEGAFTNFISFNKKIVLDELLRLSKAQKKFVLLVNTCRYIKKELNKDRLKYGAFYI